MFPQNEDFRFGEFQRSLFCGSVFLEEKCLSAKRGKADVGLEELLILRKVLP